MRRARSLRWMSSTMIKTTAAMLVLLALGSAACTASTADPYPAVAVDRASVTETAPAELIGTWQSTTVQGDVSSWTFEHDGSVTHSVVVVSGPAACRHTTTTVYEGKVQIEGRTLAYSAIRATGTNADCKGTVTSPSVGYVETLTYELAGPNELVLREVSRCQETDRASKDAACRTSFAKT